MFSSSFDTYLCKFLEDKQQSKPVKTVGKQAYTSVCTTGFRDGGGGRNKLDTRYG